MFLVSGNNWRRQAHDHKMADDVNMGQNGLSETPDDADKIEDLPENQGVEASGESLQALVEEATHEYQDISNTMDKIDEWMTNIEHQNDSLVSKLQELLESNRQIRADLQQQNAAEEPPKTS